METFLGKVFVIIFKIQCVPLILNIHRTSSIIFMWQDTNLY